jgi:hypothetical protein
MSEDQSYLKVNYVIRPAKNIERKMMSEAISRLSVFCRVKSYRYIGMGSTFYGDFTLFHRNLGLSPMYSIQKQYGDEERFNFNIPLGCVENRFGDSTAVLPGFNWLGIPTIVWLDYDEKMSPYMFTDIEYLTSVLHPSSMLIVTLERQGSRFGMLPKERYSCLKETFQDRFPLDLTQSDVVNENFHKVIKQMVDASIGDTLRKRNSGLTRKEQTEFKQIFYFTYADSTPMMTIGGLFLKKSENNLFSRCDYKSLPFYKPGQSPYQIYAPNLTLKEQRALDKQLPSRSLKLRGVPTKDVNAYARLYRYFPHFVEAEL